MGQDLFETLKNKYTYKSSAEALFFNGEGHKALRVVAHDIGVEFTDRAYIGTDPSGMLYYNYRDHFDEGDTVNYKVTREIDPSDKRVLAHVKFFSDDETLCHAEFLAYDLVRNSGLGLLSGGRWQNLTLGYVTATITKIIDQRTLYLTVAPLRQKAQWQDKDKVTGKEPLHGKAVSVNGILHYKHFNTVAKGRFANYNNDRIVFYEDDYTSTDFVAFFIPFEAWPGDLGVKANATVIYENIIWSLHYTCDSREQEVYLLWLVVYRILSGMMVALKYYTKTGAGPPMQSVKKTNRKQSSATADEGLELWGVRLQNQVMEGTM
ncbi:hypothetical protein L218DRAFT_944679 [Marasmius fiardii PR-910]|nr:hypothetical protein L218DRAFT_944679 [Marasmius fiardii PR-910]